MNAIRAFIAVELPAEMRRDLDAIIRRLQEKMSSSGGERARKAVRWVPSDNIHLTLKFLGEVSNSNVEVLARMLRSEAAHHKPFQVKVEGLGAFPNKRRPRVIWIGSEAPPTLMALQNAIEAETRALGYPTEDRPFSPHLTLGRISQNATPQEVSIVSQVISQEDPGFIGTVQVNGVHLFRSDLKPTGAEYTSLYSFPLGG